MFNKDNKETRYLTEAAIKELVDGLMRTAFSDQAREMEKHLTDIDKRLRQLETKRP